MDMKISESHGEKTRSGNDGVRVSSWVSNFLSDIRKRGPEPLNQSGTSSKEPPPKDDTDEESFTVDDEIDAINEASGETKDETTVEPSRFRRIIYAGEVFGRFTQTGENSMESFTSIGRRKISELYQKLSVNRIKYSEIKGKRMEAKRILQELQDVKDERPAEEMAPFPIEDDFLAYPEAAGTQEKGQCKRMGIGDIGRSSSANPSMKRKALSEIGRRFSEMNDEQEGSSMLGSEQNSSYPNSGSFNTSSLTIKSDPGVNNNPKSLPASPTPRLARKSAPDEGSRHHPPILHDMSIQSDSSRCSSVESLLEARKPDAETILINLGFGPVQSEDILSRIPKRFLKPSQVRGIDTDAFLKHQQLANHLHDHSVLGYRGLVDYEKSQILRRFHRHAK
ncbi:uncharacterized protein LOC132260764 isoform X2 [Phlebotomus argentipes]|uniref:uncharacterized protein LOC132260764 isoform X2 n=1 Tax=Phlebotomus argentipes TaxID=94469 RepID=UPI002892DCF0|nr:uncharacterized protein LOC132260764 isoform X2 [Phlebotomus argentipes]